MEKILSYTKYLILNILLFLFPLFFLPITQEYFITNKMYLLAFVSLVLILISTLELLVSKKLVWQKKPLDNIIFLIFLTVGLSILIASPNKIQALLNPSFGLVPMLSLTIIYFYLSRKKTLDIECLTLNTSIFILSLITIIFFFQPFKNASLPQNLIFLKNPFFTPLGNFLDLAVFLGFFVIFGLNKLIKKGEESEQNTKYFTLNTLYFIFALIALSLTLFSLIQHQAASLQLPPFRLSWYAAVETLKKPLTAFFGVGIDNFSTIFNQVRDFTFNRSPLWQTGSFVISRSSILHLFTETGLFGLVALILLLVSLIRQAFSKRNGNLATNPLILHTLYFILVLILLPPSLPLFFLLYFFVATVDSQQADSKSISTDLSDLIPLYLGIITLSFLVLGGLSYLLGRAYLAEYYFKKSMDGYLKNSGKELYDNQRQAIVLNPFNENFRINFSQTNFLIANNLANQKKGAIAETDRQTITQAVQAAISEAKAAVALNPQKSVAWANLASIYRNIINVVQGADVWTISSYQRAIILDAQNPTYRLNLGGVYYSLGKYDEAVSFFEQSASLKPDWPNAHYNLAWAAYQKGDYQRAVSEMQTILTLISPTQNEGDYKKAQADLEEFKKKLPEGSEASESATINPPQLNLPSPPATKVEPKLQLPAQASPETKE